MDSALPQISSFDFDRLDPIALEDTLAYLRQYPEPPAEDVALCGGYLGLLDDAVGERDWMAEPLRDMGGQSRHQGLLHSIASPGSASTSGYIGSSESERSICDGHMATEQPKALRLKPVLTPVTPGGKCTWDGCQSSYSDSSLGSHLEAHSRDAVAHWIPKSKCTWQGCKSKSIFEVIRQFNKHLENIHTKPLVCTERHCTYKRPFRNEHDLERHHSTKHATKRSWECPYDSCPSETRTFARKDKWLKHIQENQHENDAFCPFYHCRLLAPSLAKPSRIAGRLGIILANITLAELSTGIPVLLDPAEIAEQMVAGARPVSAVISCHSTKFTFLNG